MNAWLASLPGTATGQSLAVVFALTSAFFHALFGSLQKRGNDPWLNRGVFDLWIFLLALPVALFAVPWPSPALWGVLLGALVVHFGYKLTMTLAYERADYTVVYPVVRGSSPVVAVLAASFFFNESYTFLQWVGIGCLSGGILALSAFNIRRNRLDPTIVKTALAWALLCGFFVAAYTTWDAYGIRLADTPLTFLAWFFVVTAIDFPAISYRRWRSLDVCPHFGRLMILGILGACTAFISFGGVMIATYLDKVGEAAVLRETSTVFAALIGWLVLKERVSRTSLMLMVLIALGAIIVEFGH